MSWRAGAGLGTQSFPFFSSLQTSHAGTTVPSPATSRGPVRDDRNPVSLPVTTAVTMAVEGCGEGENGLPLPNHPPGLLIRAHEGRPGPARARLGSQLFCTFAGGPVRHKSEPP